MDFVQVTKELPRFGERVVVRTVDDYFFTAILEADEEGDYWVYDLPIGMAAGEGEVTQGIVSWAYIK